MSATVLPTTFEDELQDCVFGQEAKKIPGSNKIIMIHNAVYIFSELKFAHEQEFANHYGVMKIAYTNTYLNLGLSLQQGADTT